MAMRERVVHLDDLILRRTLMALLGQVNRPLLEELADIVLPILRWSPRDAEAEVERAAQLLEKVHGVMAARSKSPLR
jgi:glycerol-3-phosphate dehydrogenase